MKKIEELDQAVERFRQRDYEPAFNLLREATRKYPALPPARLMLARLFLANNQIPLGRAALETASVEAPKYPGVYLVFGDLAVSEGRLTDALVHYERAATLARSEQWTEKQRGFFLTQYHAGMASVAEARNGWSAARTSLAAWLELQPESAQARQRLARALFHLDQTAEAQQELERAVRDDPTQQPVAVTLGWLYTQKGDLNKAAEWMQSAVERAPHDPKAHLGRAAWLLQQGKLDESQAHTETVAKIDSNSRELTLLRGLIALCQKDYAQATDYFRAVQQECPERSQATSYLALALVEQADEAKRAEALELAQRNVREHPRSGQALSTLGWVYYRNGKLESAEQALLAAMADGKIGPENGYYMARVLAETGRHDQARQFLKAALETPGGFLWRDDAQQWFEEIKDST